MHEACLPSQAVLETQYHIARIHAEQGSAGEAIVLYDDIVAAHVRLHGLGSIQVAETLFAIANLCQHEQKAEAALQLLRQARAAPLNPSKAMPSVPAVKERSSTRRSECACRVETLHNSTCIAMMN
jgi:hypothetical protein